MKLKALILGAALSGSSLLANTVTLSWSAPAVAGGNGGGEFKAVTDNHGTFLTFCLEYTQHVSLGTPYSYTMDNTVKMQNDNLSQGTVFLYTQFVLNTLSGPVATAGDYEGLNVAQHAANAGLLQKAIWMLEDEAPWGYDNTNFYVALAESTFGGMANAKADDLDGHYLGLLNVDVMNLTNASGADIQSQLHWATRPRIVPDSGMTVALLGLGLASLLAFRRKL